MSFFFCLVCFVSCMESAYFEYFLFFFLSSYTHVHTSIQHIRKNIMKIHFFPHFMRKVAMNVILNGTEVCSFQLGFNFTICMHILHLFFFLFSLSLSLVSFFFFNFTGLTLIIKHLFCLFQVSWLFSFSVALANIFMPKDLSWVYRLSFTLRK